MDAAIRAANQAFYAAFAAGDLAAMNRLWADQPEISCIHPGWGPLVGRAEVMASWRAILARPPAVRAEGEHVVIHGDTALVLCRERIGQGMLAATNLFTRTADGWRMIHHQAGPMAQQEQPAASRLH